MANFFYRLYIKSRKQRILFFLTLLLFTAMVAFTASNIQLEEDITRLIPQDENVGQVSEALQGLEINKRLVFHLYLKDTTAVNPDLLIAAYEKLADTLKSHYAGYIDEITGEVPDNQIEALHEYYLKNLPFYLEKEDYELLEERIQPQQIEASLNKFYKTLMSPVGIGAKRILVKDPLGLATIPLERSRDLQINENFNLYKNNIISNDRKHLIFFAELVNPPGETSKNGELMEILENLAPHYENQFDGIAVEYFGSAAVSVANANRIKKDIYLTVTLAVIILFLFISLFYKNIFTFFIVVIPGIFGALVALAVLVLIRDSISMISLGIGSILLGITIDYALHFFTHYKHERNVGVLFRDLTTPLTLSSLTTASAFLSLLFIRSAALQDLGIFVAISVVSAVLFTLIVLPHFIIKTGEVKPSKENFVERWIGDLAGYPLHKKKWVLALLVVLTIVSALTWQKFTFESDMHQLSYMPEDLEQSQERIDAISTFTSNNIHVAIRGNDLWDALEKNASVVKELEMLEQQDSIYGYMAMDKIIPSKKVQQKRLQQWRNFWYKYSADSAIAVLNSRALQLGFRENTFAGFTELLTRPYEGITDEEADKMLDIFGKDLIISNADGGISIVSSAKLAAENKPEVLNTLAALPGIVIMDRAYLASRLVSILRDDFNMLVNISLGIVFLIVLVTFGRIELALIVFTPILLSWLWVLGIMGVMGLSFNIVNIIVCTFIFGLGIDYSIFVLRGLTQDHKYGVANLKSYKTSIILSAFTTLTGIGVMILAQHPALKSIAMLAIIGILAVIFLTFTVEQSLFNSLILNRKRKGVVPYTFLSLIFTAASFSGFLLGCLVLYVARLLFLLPIGSRKKKKQYFHWLMMIFSRFIIYVTANNKKTIIGKEHVNFNKPSVIISNHHSFIDILLLLMFDKKVVMVTNDWVYHSPFFGKAVQYADFIKASKGIENQLDKIEGLINEGYSIIIYPEGTRSGTFQLRRFHKGAFYLAEHFQLDIQPVIIHGTSMVMPKGDDFYLKNSDITVKFLPRISHGDTSFGEGYSERTKTISRHFKKAYLSMRSQIETPEYFREIIIKNFLYKGPVLEWYLKVKYRLEKGYQLFHELIPRECRVVDLGCGYGMMSYALGLSAGTREIFAVDYDKNKIQVARNCPVKPDNITFVDGDVVDIECGEADVFIISDVLHYLQKDEQQKVLKKMARLTRPGGKIIIRDGDGEKTDKHKSTKLTEFFSVGIGFNKTRNEMNYISGEMIRKFAGAHGFNIQAMDDSRNTSNTIFVLTR
ncbi:hypothetical protein C900_02901 [Fulvivirga imtechensis AK7]|uniref:Phospholipid/glycerol acyltransferase domain-containing protein n=1 Tax=Fulvivirga imtechensis AK7 TaxID=1237149 RepID=L8JQR3_9BACT|nr:trifunctional MMPL family transporter/lysophospholipid acyltransferase/class I SAM-dependent methyltransferase [Fulvivirga imtechensis]ELR71286.1 hypothetical protein C900_02901 [Fulvivirga imtechensis AK7]